MQIPTFDTANIIQTDLAALMRIGFCYVKIDKSLQTSIQICRRLAHDFFNSSMVEKSRWKLKETLNPGDRYQGYVLRSHPTNIRDIEQFFFEPDAPYGPYKAYASQIQNIDRCFTSSIYFPLFKAIFNSLQLSTAEFNDAAAEPSRSLVFQTFPTVGGHKKDIRLNEHKDFGSMTVVHFVEPGLEVRYEGKWVAIPPKPDCVIVNLGNALEVMSGEQCHSALHRVVNETDNRLSMVYFYSPNFQRPVQDYINQKQRAVSGEAFFKQQFTEYYETNH